MGDMSMKEKCEKHNVDLYKAMWDGLRDSMSELLEDPESLERLKAMPGTFAVKSLLTSMKTIEEEYL